jgi:translation initiation factor 1 (eIF-1/SUI1)
VLGALVSFFMGLTKYLKDRRSEGATIQKNADAIKIEMKGLTQDQINKLMETVNKIIQKKSS